MIDLLQAAQDALFAALKPIEGQAGMPTGLSVFQHVPEDTQPPMIVLGLITSENADDKGDQFELITAEVQCAWRGAGRAPLLAIMHAVRVALDDQPLLSPVAQFERPHFLRADAAEAIVDGLTYIGSLHFEFHAEPA